MGNFDTSIQPKYSIRSRSVLSQSVGPNAVNAPKDLYLIVQTLKSAGLLDTGITEKSTPNAINEAIQQVRRSLLAQGITSNNHDNQIRPGDEVEHAVRSAIVQGRLSLSHRIIAESDHQKEPRTLIDGGMTRALKRLNEPAMANQDYKSPYRRALLPSISAQTFQANRRLAEALTPEENIINLAEVIAYTIADNGKQGYSDVKDFLNILRKKSPDIADKFEERVQLQLDGKALRRFHKLINNRPPVENDFDNPTED